MRFLSGMYATALVAALAFTGVSVVDAAPLISPSAPTAQPDVIQVRDGVVWRRNQWNRNRYRSGPRNNFRRNGNYAWYNGHRGYRYQRNGYAYYNGFWFPGAAFIAGAIIGGALANDGYGGGYGPRYYLDGNQSDAHVRWCYDRYRSYRARDNTFQPYNGPRRQCYSPYD